MRRAQRLGEQGDPVLCRLPARRRSSFRLKRLPVPRRGGRWAAEDLGGRRHAGEIPARPRIPQAARPTVPGRLALTQLGLANGTGGPEGPSGVRGRPRVVTTQSSH